MELKSQTFMVSVVFNALVSSVFYRSMMGSGREPDLVHLEAKTVDGRKYISFQISWYSGLPSYSCNHRIS